MWSVIEDSKVLHVWKSRDTEDGYTCEVPPTFYEESGTPIHPDTGEDLEYSHTLIDRS